MKLEAPAFASASGRVKASPNRNTIGLLALLMAIWYAGASQNNGAAYLFGFVLTGVALVSLLHASANLRGLQISCGALEPVFAGESQRLPLVLRAAPGRSHLAVRFHAPERIENCAVAEVRGALEVRAELWLETPGRGRFEELRLRVTSLFPLGFFTASFTVVFHHTRWVYPQPKGTRPLPQRLQPLKRPGSGARLEGDDFAGVRPYVPGEPQRHIDWKAAARGQELVIKQWAGEADETLQLRWCDTEGLAQEARISQLASWVTQAERGGRSYTLEVPDANVSAGRGAAHYHECLRKLAVFPHEVKAP
jgi:uncharacterized protein (DUF58 family)